MMFEVEYLILAVRNIYRGHDDFERIYTFLETMYISNRIKLPLKGILLTTSFLLTIIGLMTFLIHIVIQK